MRDFIRDDLYRHRQIQRAVLRQRQSRRDNGFAPIKLSARHASHDQNQRTGVFAASATLLSRTSRDQASATAECGSAGADHRATASQRFVQRNDDSASRLPGACRRGDGPGSPVSPSGLPQVRPVKPMVFIARATEPILPVWECFHQHT